MNLTHITIYPVKSCAGISLQQANLDRFGVTGDRRWMVVTIDGSFLTQREFPRMALIKTGQSAEGILLECEASTIQVPVPSTEGKDFQVILWEENVLAQDAGDTAAQWLSKQLETDVRLVYMPKSSLRKVDDSFAQRGETVNFADSAPLLLISQASLDDLNSRLPTPVPMNRFRPNLVISGCEAFAEDTWQRIRIGEVEFDVAKSCARCVMPSIIQETAQRDKTINRALAGFRRSNKQILFGQYLLYRELGQLNTGDVVEVLS